MSPSVTAACMGSSPRVRGTLLRDCGRDDRTGIIPACAGNTLIGRGALPRSGDHPRMCGEHPGGHEVEWDRSGSSPRVRGTPGRGGHNPNRVGIIPACAGNTARGPCTTRPCRDHPRVCGEHEKSQPVFMVSLGSSPRVRGTRPRGGHGLRALGIIPACAGNTRYGSRGYQRTRDHPRVCGEHRLQ